MKKPVTLAVILITAVCIAACRRDLKANSKGDYNQYATELISQIFKHPDYECANIIVPELNMLKEFEAERPNYDVAKDFLDKLHIKSRTQLDSLAALSNGFKFTPSMFAVGSRILSIRAFRAKKTEMDSLWQFGTQAQKDSMISTCPNKFYIISKPVFDRDYETAVFEVGMAFTCISPPLRVYKRISDQWVLQDPG